MYKTMINILLLVASLLTISSCEKTGLCKDDELQMTRTDYTGNQLDIQGYYFGDTTINSEPTLASIYIFYHNGILQAGGAVSLEMASNNNIPFDLSNDLAKNTKGGLGIFQIDGSDIEIEYWQSSINGCETTVYEEGEILNDTTFVITLREYREDGEVEKREELNSEFHFRPLAQKPDSTNNFID